MPKTTIATAVSTRGFTIIELVVSVIIVGILSAAAFAIFPDITYSARARDAVNRAGSINTAKLTYRSLVSTSSASYSAAASDSAKFDLIKGYIPFASSQTLAQYQPTGFTFGLGAALDTPVAITGPRGTVTY